MTGSEISRPGKGIGMLHIGNRCLLICNLVCITTMDTEKSTTTSRHVLSSRT